MNYHYHIKQVQETVYTATNKMMSSMFGSLQELDNLLNMRDSENSTIIIKASVNFQNICRGEKVGILECMSFSSQEMNSLLRKIYAET